MPAGRDPDDYDRARRRVLWSLPTGLYVVGSRSGDRRNLMTCSWIMQVATSPKLVAVAIERSSLTWQLVEESGWFSISALDRADRALVRRFVKPADDVELDDHGRAVAIGGTAVTETLGGVPRLRAARAWLACTRRASGVADDDSVSHRLVVGEVVDVGGPVADDPGGAGRPEVLRMEDTRMNYGG
ncbi:MAG: flavin reductase family protein [Acidimicrobiales bacterium]|nr:flavin reductase family protein [Acidimicrobiales bacterium]